MAFLDKLMFWKHKEEAPAVDLGMGSATGLDQGNLGFDQQYAQQQPFFPTGVPAESAMAPDQYAQQYPQRQFQQPGNESLTPTFKPPMNMQAPQGAQQQYFSQEKESELIAAKLDAIKANLESINQRLANIERIAYGEKQQEKKYSW